MLYIKVNKTQSLPCWKLVRLREGLAHTKQKAVHVKCQMNGRDNKRVEFRRKHAWDGQRGLRKKPSLGISLVPGTGCVAWNKSPLQPVKQTGFTKNVLFFFYPELNVPAESQNGWHRAQGLCKCNWREDSAAAALGRGALLLARAHAQVQLCPASCS